MSAVNSGDIHSPTTMWSDSEKRSRVSRRRRSIKRLSQNFRRRSKIEQDMRTTYISLFILGAVCIIIGIFNSKGHISTLHSYHRKRVSEEDRIPFGKRIGLGMIIIGVSVIISGVLCAIDYFSCASFKNPSGIYFIKLSSERLIFPNNSATLI